MSKGCKLKCSKCKGNHNVLLCQSDVPFVSKDLKDNSELEKLPSGDMSDKGVIGSDSGSEKPASHVGVDLTA